MDDALLQFCDFIIAAKDKTPLFHINQLISKICNSTADEPLATGKLKLIKCVGARFAHAH